MLKLFLRGYLPLNQRMHFVLRKLYRYDLDLHGYSVQGEVSRYINVHNAIIEGGWAKDTAIVVVHGFHTDADSDFTIKRVLSEFLTENSHKAIYVSGEDLDGNRGRLISVALSKFPEHLSNSWKY